MVDNHERESLIKEDSLKGKNMLSDANKQVTYRGEDMLSVLQEIEYMLISLHKMGSYYCDKDRRCYEEETTRFIDNSLICDRLAKIRRCVCVGFDLQAGEDEMDDVERVCAGLPVWTQPGEYSTEQYL